MGYILQLFYTVHTVCMSDCWSVAALRTAFRKGKTAYFGYSSITYYLKYRLGHAEILIRPEYTYIIYNMK